MIDVDEGVLKDIQAENEQLRAENERLKVAAREVLARYGRRDPATQLPPASVENPVVRVPALENLDYAVQGFK